MLPALITVSLLVCQDPGSEKPPAGKPAVEKAADAKKAAEAAAKKKTAKKVVFIEDWDDKRAKAAAKELGKVVRSKKSSMRDRNKALEVIATARNDAFVKPLVRCIERDESVVIRRRAAQLLGNQPPKKAGRAILKLVNNGRVSSHPTLQAEMIKALSRCGYEARHWQELDDLFERYYELDRVPLQEAILELVAQHKEKQAIPILLRNLDEPIPTNVHGGDNPPASYWEARWKSWKRWRPKVKEALFAITGQRFSTAEEAKVWLEKNKLK